MNRLAIGALSLVVALVAVAQAQDKLNPTGTWKWEQKGRGGNPQENTLKLKVDGDKVTGTVSAQFQGEARENPISDASYKNGELKFSVTVMFGDNKRTTKYSGKVSETTIKGKMEREGKDANVTTDDWEAKRVTDKK